MKGPVPALETEMDRQSLTCDDPLGVCRVLRSLRSLPLLCLPSLSSFLTTALSRLPTDPSIFPKQHFRLMDSASEISLRVDSDWLSTGGPALRQGPDSQHFVGDSVSGAPPRQCCSGRKCHRQCGSHGTLFTERGGGPDRGCRLSFAVSLAESTVISKFFFFLASFT